MRMSVAQQLNELGSKLMGYVGLMSYRYCNLCVKAEASSLLAFEQNYNGIDKKIEDLADIYVHEKESDGDDVTMRLFPKQSHYIQLIMQGMMDIHPEFKMTLEKYDESIEDDKDSMDNRYVKLVMPEVDDERHDLLLNLIDTMDKACSVKMDAVVAQATAKITKLTLNDDQKALDEVKEALENQKNQYIEMRETLTADKKQEVEDAYQYYLEKNGKDAKSLANSGNDGKSSMFDSEKNNQSEKQTNNNSQSTKTKPEEKPQETKNDPFGGSGQSLSMD